MISRVELRTMLTLVTMKVNEEQSILLEQVSAIQNWHNTVTHKIDEEELIAVKGLLTSCTLCHAYCLSLCWSKEALPQPDQGGRFNYKVVILVSNLLHSCVSQTMGPAGHSWTQ
jgi:hypothetical protein